MSSPMNTQASNVQTSAVTALQQLIKAQRLDAYLVLSADEHINEYLPPENQRRQFVTGFTGSAGDCLIPAEGKAMLFADSRYYEQTDYEVDATTVQVSKVGMEGHPTLIQQLKSYATQKPGFRLGMDAFTIPHSLYQELEKLAEQTGLVLCPTETNLLDTHWGTDRPKPVLSSVYAVPDSYTGRSTAEKLSWLQQWMTQHRVDVFPITKLDQIAWLFNLRGQDIDYNPVFIAYSIVTPGAVHLFSTQSRFEQAAIQSLQSITGIQLHPYQDYAKFLTVNVSGKRVLLDPKHTTYGTVQVVSSQQGVIVILDNPVEIEKGAKNATELRWMRETHYKSGQAKIKALYWLEQQLQAQKTVTEKSFADYLESCYAQVADYRGLSFNTIAGAGANSSIVHYGTPSSEKQLVAGELFLVDSGIQCLGGTTDDTRTVIVGEPTDLQKLRYTEVLKAHINCASQIFPKGTEGARLDGITRATLWQHQLDYGHGTGHGVGAFLNVHEGPYGIHKMATKPFVPGAIVSVEPGYYEPGWGGIRLENLYVVVEKSPGWYGFETLTYIPFDKRLIDVSRLNAEQRNWLRQYHQQVVDIHSKTLDAETLTWLKTIVSI